MELPFIIWFLREDDEADRLYEEFVKYFKTDDVPGGKAFVRGENIDPNELLKTRNEGLCQIYWYT